MKRVLLLSNSTMPGDPYLQWATAPIKQFLGEAVTELLFLPFAGVTITWDHYTDKVAEALAPIKVTGLHTIDHPKSAIESAQAIAIGGGNTFQLLANMHSLELIEPLREQVSKGTPLLGWSAGSNVCCPTLRTTNDMPIVEPKSFEALSLVPFQVNAHYTTKKLQGHGGESRMDRLQEFLAVNPEVTIAALPEGTYLSIEDERVSLHGNPMTVLRAGQEAQEYQAGQQFTLNLEVLAQS